LEYRKLGKSDLKVSVIGLGAGQFGSRPWGYGIRFGDEDIIKIIQGAIELGINVFDTAETYGYGVSEMLLGRALNSYSRDDFVIISKVAPWNLRYEHVMKAAERSLRRLNIDVIDLYLVHYPNPLVPMKETFRAMERLVKKGKIRYIGVSNFSSHMLKKAQESLSFAEIVADEIEYNIFCRRAEKEIIPYCSRQNIGVIAYSPLAGGVLTGKYSPNNPPKDRARAFNFLARKSFLEKAQPLFKVLREIAEEKGASCAQVALSWIISHPSCVAIPAALTYEQVKDNAKAGDLILSAEDIKRINDATISLGFSIYVFDHYVIRPISWMKEAIKHFLFSEEKTVVSRLNTYKHYV
jgi:aryl-alcohol dehydrogenase-like predicted oxidoreductase